MTTSSRFVFLGAALAALLLPAAAQNSTTSNIPVDQKPPVTQKSRTVAQRKKIQQERVAQGIKSGELNSREAARIEHQETRLNQETREMREDGKLTAAERAKLQKQQNKLSKEIYNQKHDAQSQPTPKTEIGQRKENQQDRIAQGVASGQLTPAEASRLEKRESRINQETRAMRAENGGKLTAEDKAKVNRQQNHTSRAIHHQKHDAQHR
jgi:hypothetical protein